MGRTKKMFADVESRATREEVLSLNGLHDMIDSKDIEIMELKHQIVGYKAVISYLEHQLGLNKSQ